MAVICRTGISDLHSTRCSIAWRGDFSELHARTGLLTLDLDDRTLMLTSQPVCMRPIARELASLLASGFALAPSCGGTLIVAGPETVLFEATQIGSTVSLRLDTLPDYRVIVHGQALHTALITFLRTFK
jgi:hypothetical protein